MRKTSVLPTGPLACWGDSSRQNLFARAGRHRLRVS